MVTQKKTKFAFQYKHTAVNIYHANKGEGLQKHEHTYSHTVYCSRGSLLIRKEGVEKLINPESMPISLKEKEWHELEALEDNTIFITTMSG